MTTAVARYLAAFAVVAGTAVVLASTPMPPLLLDPGNDGELTEISWNPGHYVAFGLTTDQPGGVAGHVPQHREALDSLLNGPWCKGDAPSVITGFLVKVHWRNVQFDRLDAPPDFGIIDEWYDAARSRCGTGKRLVVVFKVEAENQFYGPAFDPATHGPNSGHTLANIGRRACAPQELWDGGEVVEDPTMADGHCMPAIWRDPARTALKHTLTALGRYLNDKPLVEAVFFEGEGSKGWVNRSPNPLGFSQAGLVEAYRDALLTLRAAAPNKIVGVGTNNFDPRAGWEELVLSTCRETLGCAFIWPDTFSAERPFPHTDAHPHYCANSGTLGLFGGQEAPLKGRWFPVAPAYRGDAVEAALDHCCYNPGKAVDLAGVPDGYCTTHTWWRPGALSGSRDLDDTFIIEKLRTRSSPVYSRACPDNVTRLGGVCVTGGT